MTRTSSSLNADRPLATQTHGTTFRSECAQPITSVKGNEYGCASESDPLTSSPGDHSQESNSESPEIPRYSTGEILGVYAICVALGFAAMALAHVKLERDLDVNWERIND